MTPLAALALALSLAGNTPTRANEAAAWPESRPRCDPPTATIADLSPPACPSASVPVGSAALRPVPITPAPITPAPITLAPAPFLGEDKLRHLGMAFAVTEVGFAIVRLGASAGDARAAGIGLGAVASIGKELYDVRRGRRFDVFDLVWDLAGITLGTVLIHQIE